MNIDYYFTKIGTVNTARLRKITQEEISWVEEQTSFLFLEPKISSRLRVIKSNIIEHPKCPCCGKHLKFSPSKESIFVDFCSMSCAKKTSNTHNSATKFKNTLNDKKKQYEEILRYCNKKYTNVIGGFSRLLKHFTRNYTGSVVSYANKRLSKGNLYEKNNFVLMHDSSPNYFYFIDKKTLYSRNYFQKHKLKDKLETFNPDLTEKENMFNNGYRRIWDCGNKVYILNQ